MTAWCHLNCLRSGKTQLTQLFALYSTSEGSCRLQYQVQNFILVSLNLPLWRPNHSGPFLNLLMIPPVFSKEGIFLLISARLSSPRHPAILSKPLFFNRTVSVSMNSVYMLRCLSWGSFIHKGSGNQPLNTFRDTYESRLLPCKTEAQPVERSWPVPLGVQECLILWAVGNAFPSLWLPDAVTCKALRKGGNRCQSMPVTQCFNGVLSRYQTIFGLSNKIR